MTDTVGRALFREIYNTPALLVLNQDFNDFDPRTHPWLVINFWRKVKGWNGGQGQFEYILGELVEVITNANTDFSQQPMI